MIDSTVVAAVHAKQPFYTHLYFPVLLDIIPRIALRLFHPTFRLLF